MTGIEITTHSEMATQACGGALARLLAQGDVLLLSGDLGAGKTQLTKGIGAGLGVSEPITSPTFNMLLLHQGRLPLYHFDLYRLDAADQLEDIDYSATIEGDGVAVVEWGDRFAQATPSDGLSVVFGIVGDEERCLTVRPLGDRGETLVAAWAEACTHVEGVEISGGAVT